MPMPDAPTPKKPLCFVIGPIGHAGTEERKHADFLLRGLVRHVLETEEFGYVVKRADEDADPGMIGDRVITDILQADLVVADLTGLNPNAFYELGIRHSAEMPVIHIAKMGTSLPFDNAAHRAIMVDVSDWHSIEDARTRLAASARAIKMAGYQVSNPITQANASFRMRESADPRERIIEDIRERLVSLEAKVSSKLPTATIDALLSMLPAELDDLDRTFEDHIARSGNSKQPLIRWWSPPDIRADGSKRGRERKIIKPEDAP
jgi:hypothetical protein